MGAIFVITLTHRLPPIATQSGPQSGHFHPAISHAAAFISARLGNPLTAALIVSTTPKIPVVWANDGNPESKSQKRPTPSKRACNSPFKPNDSQTPPPASALTSVPGEPSSNSRPINISGSSRTSLTGLGISRTELKSVTMGLFKRAKGPPSTGISKLPDINRPMASSTISNSDSPSSRIIIARSLVCAPAATPTGELAAPNRFVPGTRANASRAIS